MLLASFSSTSECASPLAWQTDPVSHKLQVSKDGDSCSPVSRSKASTGWTGHLHAEVCEIKHHQTPTPSWLSVGEVENHSWFPTHTPICFGEYGTLVLLRGRWQKENGKIPNAFEAQFTATLFVFSWSTLTLSRQAKKKKKVESAYLLSKELLGRTG